MVQENLKLAKKTSGPIDCLGQKFSSDAARREHYLKLLAQKLKDPEFRKIDGFPIGKDEDILALSDPPYYTACPNPWLGEFIRQYGAAYEPKIPYHREPFASDVSEGKYDPLYMLHPYPTKVPHRAIMRYILCYTEPGDLVFDGFCGTGSTGVAAQLCQDVKKVQELGYSVDKDGIITNETGQAFSKIGARFPLLGDLCPSATFIAKAYNHAPNFQDFYAEAESILTEVEHECVWMYETRHPKSDVKGRMNYTLWSDVFLCPECGGEVIFWSTAVDEKMGEVRSHFKCQHCRSMLSKQSMERVWVTEYDRDLDRIVKQAKQTPVLINYSVNGKRYQKVPEEEDLKLITRISQTPIPYWFPKDELPEGDNTTQPKLSHGLTHLHHFYSRRNLYALAALTARIKSSDLLLLITKVSFQITKLYRFTYQSGVWGAGGGPLTGTLYIPSLVKELDIIKQLKDALKDYSRVSASLPHQNVAISTGSSSFLPQIPSDSVDYVFLDPPFGGNKMYSELNLLWELWLRVRTAPRCEAIQNKTQKKGIDEYRTLIEQCLAEVYRVLKPGRWLTVEFSNTQAAVWNAIQSAIQEAGFVVANVSALDKKKKAFKAVVSPTAVKQDLIISAYKPNGGLEERFTKLGETEEGVWDFIRSHLKNLPVVKAKGGELEFITERDPRILYDRMVAYYVGHSTLVPLSSAEFQAGLAEKFPERDGMYFLPVQVNEYDKKRAQMENVGQLAIFVEDERSAINWLRGFLKARPSVTQDILPDFMQQLGASWKKWEARPELGALLDQNFLRYDGQGDVPSQIHSYVSTQFKDLRNLPKDHAQLKAKAKNRWYVPDPKKNLDVEMIRNKKLLEEFWTYLPNGYTPPTLTSNKGQMLPRLAVPRPKIPKGKKLKEIRTEAVRVGFKHCYQQKDYQTILVVAEMLPESVLNEDDQLQMIYDTAVTRTAGE